jgi:hypothetical protein
MKQEEQGVVHAEVTQGSKRLYASGIYHRRRLCRDFGSPDRAVSLAYSRSQAAYPHSLLRFILHMQIQIAYA